MLTFQRVLLLACSLIACLGYEVNVGHYLTPQQLTVNETQSALKLFLPTLKFKENTICWLNSKLYTILNYQIDMNYNPKQEKVVIDWEKVDVSGGVVQIDLKFNYTMRDFKTDNYVTGWVSGTAFSQLISYSKNLTVKGQWPFWNITSPLKFSVKKGFTLKYMNPYTVQDAKAIGILLQGTDQQIDLRPSPLYEQIKQLANPAISDFLKTTINNYFTLHTPTNYTYRPATGTVIQSNLTRKLKTLSLSPKQGFVLTYHMLSSYWTQEQHACFYADIPRVSADSKLYGSHVIIHSHCIYLAYAFHMHFYGAANRKFDQTWDVPEFSFKAGSLYNIVEGLQAVTDPNSPLTGQCVTQMPQNNTLFNRIKTAPNSYFWNMSYTCKMATKSKESTNLPVLDFTARAMFKVGVKYDFGHLTVVLQSFQKVELIFKTVGSFKVKDQKLAVEKAGKVLKNVVGTKVYGTGYPMIMSQEPAIEQKQEFVIYYDKATVPKQEHKAQKQELREQVVEQ